MSISSHMEGELCIIQIQQALSSDIHVFLKEKLRELMREGHSKIVLDLSRAGFVSSSLIGAMIYGLKEAKKKGGNLGLAQVDSAFLDVLKTTKLDKVFYIFDSIEEAVQNFKVDSPEDDDD
jgi:anti-sigma B factor antagonist